MRIGLVTSAFLPLQNGVTRLVSLYKKHLELLGHEALVFTYGDPHTVVPEDIIYSPGITLGKTGYSYSFRMSERAKERLCQMDIIHYHHPVMSIDMTLRGIAVPVVFTNHTRYDIYAQVYLPLPSNLSNRAVQRFWPTLVSRADWIIAPSHTIADMLKQLGLRRPISVIPNGIELDAFSSVRNAVSRKDLGVSQQAILLIFVGRLSAEKRIHRLIDIAARAKKTAPHIELILVGDGPARQSLEEKAKKQDLAVRFVGEVPFDRVPSYLAAADIFVTASDSEVHPLTVIEAIAAGLPVIGRCAIGLSETIEHGKNGYTMTTSDAETAQAIARLANNAELRRQMGARSREMSSLFDIRHTIKQSIHIYQQLIEKNGSRDAESNSNKRIRFFPRRPRIEA